MDPNNYTGNAMSAGQTYPSSPPKANPANEPLAETLGREIAQIEELTMSLAGLADRIYGPVPSNAGAEIWPVSSSLADKVGDLRRARSRLAEVSMRLNSGL